MGTRLGILEGSVSMITAAESGKGTAGGGGGGGGGDGGAGGGGGLRAVWRASVR